MLKPCAILLGVALLLRPLAAEACGGGTVSPIGNEVGADAQRIFISVNGATTEVVTQIIVPESSADYGVLIPVPVEPTLDTQPISAADLNQLDKATAPRIQVVSYDAEDGGGCLCIPTTGGGGEDLEPLASIQLSEPVDIGPVTALVLTGDTVSAVDGWLQEQGFAISGSNRLILAAYSGSGQYFIAIRRNQAVKGGPSSIGIHFTLPGDQRGLPLRFASIGAASSVAFTVIVATRGAAGPTPPFATLTIADLDEDLLRDDQYGAAVDRAIGAHPEGAFVLETIFSKYMLQDDYFGLPNFQGRLDHSPFLQWIAESATLTRLTTRMPATALTQDVAFTVPYRGSPSNTLEIPAAPAHPRPAHAGALCAVVLAAALRRLYRRRA